MVRARHRLDADRMARDLSTRIGREVALARANHGLSLRAAARLAGVGPRTQRRVELGSPAVQVDTACRVAAAMGLRVWAKAFLASAPSLRDTGQLWIANWLRAQAHSSLSLTHELRLGDLRAADQVWFAPTEIVHVEIERLIADLQAQYRVADEKRGTLAAMHQRPVRLVIVVEDSRRNRAAVRPHAPLVSTLLPAGSREVLHSLRTGEPLGRDGILWIRRRRTNA